jgi:hypothetical protein
MKRVSVARLLLFGVLVVAMLGLMESAFGQASVQGQWTTLTYQMPINPVHAALMRTGKVLIVSGSGNYPPNLASNLLTAAVWDPVAGTITTQSVAWDMFCNGMVVLPDGRPFINGGTIQYDPFFGQPKNAVFDPNTNTFTNVQPMAHGRWYPTPTVLGDGRVLTFSGLDELGNTNTTTEIYTPGTGWSGATSAGWTPPLYPRMHVLPNGKVFYSGSGPTSQIFDPIAGSWHTSAVTKYGGNRTFGSSVLLPLTPANGYTPKVFIMGGGQSGSTATTELIDPSVTTPAWTFGPSMSQPRVEMNAVMLPNGKVLALGGSYNDEDTSTASLNADLYDPISNIFTSAGANAFPRLYHSVALLLPDATVMFAGGNPTRGSYEPHIEIYKPAYLFDSSGAAAVRPTISSLPTPSVFYYGNTFNVQTPDAANISQVVVVRPGSPTHAFDQEQRLVGLSFTAGAGSLTVTAPPSGNIAPPGYYMLFLLNSSGVPSVASFIQFTNSPTTPASILFVQGSTGPSSLQPSNSSVAVPFSGAQAAGNLNVVAVGWGDSTSSVSSVTDTRGNTYTLAIGPTSFNGMQQSIYYAKNIAVGSNTVTVRFNQAAAYPDVRILEYSGVDTTNPLDGKAVATGTGTAANSGSIATTTANELIFGAGTTGQGFTAAGTGFANRMINVFGNIAEDKVVSATGSYNATGTVSSSAWIMQVATFRGGGQVTNPAPVVNTISPTSGTTAGGTPVTITGTGFLAGASVTIGGTAATNVVIVNSTSITATSAAHAAGSGNVVVTNSDTQSGTLPGGYTYVNPTPAPTITGIAPASGPAAGGTPVTITGTGFTAGATVTIGGAAATSVIVGSDTSITANTPAHATGAVAIVVTNADAQFGTLPGGYTYNPNPAPTISSISPTSGPASGGTPVTITGTGFLSGATVTVGGTAATSVVVVGGASITANTPAHAAGAVSVVVTNTDAQSGTLTGGYTYNPNPAPTVTGISPATGPAAGGTSVTITGTGFATGANVAIGGTAATNLVVVGSTSITARTAAHAAGTVDVVVTNPDAQFGTLSGGYVYTPNPAPAITGISPATGPAAGGTSVTITGTGFATGASVSIGGTAATNVVVVGSTSITAKTAAHTVGAVDVVVTNPDAQFGTLTGGYTYSPTPPPTVTSISPVSGPSGGGTPVTITGTGFLAGATVSFGGTAATSINVVSSTSITATTPAHASGAVNVVVTNTDAQSGTLTNGFTYNVAIAFVQANVGPPSIQPSNVSITVAYGALQRAGDLNIVVVGWGDTTSVVSSVSDTRGNVYALAVGPTTNVSIQQAIFYAKNIGAGSNAVTVTFNKAAAYPDVRILEYSGLSITNPLDVTAAATGGGKSASSGAAVTTSANELIFGAGTTESDFTAAGSGFVTRIIDVFGNNAEDRVVTAPGSYSATATNRSSRWVMQMATFK